MDQRRRERVGPDHDYCLSREGNESANRSFLVLHNHSASRASREPRGNILRLHMKNHSAAQAEAWTESCTAVARPQQQRVGFVVGCAPL
jgi:hypothetical protein